MSNVPFAVDVQPLDIIDPMGMFIVKLPVLPFMVPLTIMALPEPPTRIVPENTDPLWVTCHVVAPAVAPDIPEPIIEPLESDAEPTQVPVKLAVELGLVTAADCEPHAPAPTLAVRARRRNIHRFMTPSEVSLSQRRTFWALVTDPCVHKRLPDFRQCGRAAPIVATSCRRPFARCAPPRRATPSAPSIRSTSEISVLPSDTFIAA
jgi:hypothetical protein